MREGDAEWFGEKKQQALRELRAANPDALQLYGQLLRDNARRAGASPEEIRDAEAAQWRRHDREETSSPADRDAAKRPRGSSVLWVARDRSRWAGR
jgi:predicted nucleic acid-binding Zn ribbon protein